MSRDTNRFPRSRLARSGRLSPAEVPDAAGAPGRSSHLVLTNGAGGREETLLAVAGRLAARAGAAVRVAHVFDPPGDLEVVGPLSSAYRAGPAHDVCDRLFRAARSLAGRSGLPVTPELLVGPVDPTLIEYVRVNEFDLVTASSGSTWRTLWGGGPWVEIARRRPVVVVGPGVSESSTAEKLPGEVLVLLDGTETAERALAPAMALCRLLDARLTLLRVALSGDAGDRCHRYLLTLSQFVRRGVPAVRAVVATGWTAGAVLSVQRTTGVVVALAAPIRSWLGGVAPGRLGWRVLRRSTAPVLFYRPTL